MKAFFFFAFLIAIILSAQDDTFLIKRNFLGSTKLEKEYYVLKSDTTIMHGPYTAYHYNGRLFLKGQYQYGKRDGEWTSYHENGKIETHNYYCEGQYCGIWDYYSNEGIKEFSFNMGEMDTPREFDAYHFTLALQKILKYPEKAQENDIGGQVEIMILKDSACHMVVQLLKGFDYDCDKEAVRAVKQVMGSRSAPPCKNEMQRIQISFRIPQ
jgi:hypothetical protein